MFPNVISLYIEGLKSHDLAKIAGAVADDALFVSRTKTLNKSQFLQMLTAIYAGFPDWHYDHDPPELRGDIVAIKIRQGGTHTGVFTLPGRAAIEATGRMVTIPEHYFYYRVHGDRIVEIHPEAVPGGAPEGILQQIGAGGLPA